MKKRAVDIGEEITATWESRVIPGRKFRYRGVVLEERAQCGSILVEYTDRKGNLITHWVPDSAEIVKHRVKKVRGNA